MYCKHDNTTMYGSSEECLDCGARKHRNSFIWHNVGYGGTGPQPHPKKHPVIINKETGEVIRW